MFAVFSKLKMKYLIILSVLTALLGVGVVVLYIYKILITNQTAFVILLFIVFMLFSSFTSAIFDRILKKKMKYLGYKPKEYSFSGVDSLIETVENLEHKVSKERFGNVYYYKDGIVGYKISIVKDANSYFEVPEGEESVQGLPKLKADEIQSSYFKKCTKLVDFEIFIDPDNEYLRKIGIFNYQGDKFYFASFFTRDNTIIRADFVKPEGVFEKYYNTILDVLKITEVEVK